MCGMVGIFLAQKLEDATSQRFFVCLFPLENRIPVYCLLKRQKKLYKIFILKNDHVLAGDTNI